MSLVNIPSYKEDINYRYKMPKVKCKVEGSGNGIKTNFMNIGDVSKALKRPPEYLTKFLGCELCVQARFINKEQKGIFQGKHSEQELLAVVDKFIETYVLCPLCDLPEIDLFVKEKCVYGACNACGNECKMNNMHRVSALIVKNPPVCTTVNESKKKKRENKNVDTSKDTDSTTKEKKVRRKVKKDTTGADTTNVNGAEKKRVRVRKKKTVENIFSVRGMDGNNIISRLRELRKNDTEPSEYFKELRSLQLARDFSNSDRVYLGLKGLYDYEEKLEFDIERADSLIPYIEIIVGDDLVEAEDLILGIVEFFFHEVNGESYGKMPLFFKKLYDVHLLDEIDLRNFFQGESSIDSIKKASVTVEPLISWFDNLSESEYGDSYEDD